MSRRLRALIGAVGWTGHLFPALALASELVTRGHEIELETFADRRQLAEGTGARFRAAPDRLRFGGFGDAGDPSLAEASAALAEELLASAPDIVITDLYTLAPALAAEVAGIPRATLIPHPWPAHGDGLPFYTLGLLPPRTPVGARAWRAAWPALGTRLPNTQLGAVRAELDSTRAELGLEPLDDYDGQISDRLAIVATFPQLEYPREWPGGAHVVGPLPFELPHPDVELPPGDAPLVLIASSTERDPERRLVRTALAALANQSVRVLASTNDPDRGWDDPVPANARVHGWISYTQALREAAAVVCHGGHGTIARALAAGVPPLVVPPAGDMAENGARVSWSGAGLMLPNRLLSRIGLRLAVRELLDEPVHAARAAELAAWASEHDGAALAADLVEASAA